MGWYLAEARFKQIDEKKTLVPGYKFIVRNLDTPDPAQEIRLDLDRQLDSDISIVGDAQIMVTGPYADRQAALASTEDPNVTFGEN